ncbi:non-specific serine,threonine protein kinase [Sarracenia purpurea var. burkii]
MYIAWNLWKEGRSIELVDPTMANQCSSNEAIRYVELCLWCVQERAADRPNMQDVVLMLSNVKTTAQTLPHLPKQPSLLTYSGSTSTDDSSRSNQAHSSQSVLSISVISAR